MNTMEWDFAANAEIDEATLAKVPEGYRSAYEKNEAGAYVISAASKPFVDAITGLGGALKNERNVTKTLKGQKDTTSVIKEVLGFDSVEAAKEKLDELNGIVATASKVDPAKIKAEIEATFNKQLEAKDATVEAMRGTLSKYLIDNSVIASLAEHKGNSKLLAPLIKEMVTLVEDNGEYQVRVKDAQGDYRGDGKGGFLTVAGLVEELKKSSDYAVAFESEAPRGSAQQQQGRPAPASQQRDRGVTKREDMSAMDLIAQGLEQRTR
jgi:hypothetical protein